MVEMFQNATAFNQDLSNWAVNSSLTNGVENMVAGAAHGHFPCVLLPPSDLTQGVPTGCTSAGTESIPDGGVLRDAVAGWFNIGPPGLATQAAVIALYGHIGNWKFDAGVTDFTNLFDATADGGNPGYPTSFNDDISKWNVTHITSMNNVFAGQTIFNQPIGNWERGGSSPSTMGNVTSISGMFNDATSFNKEISAWNVANVTNMGTVFYGATSFNKELSEWNVAKVTTMDQMFRQATAFNRDLSSWHVDNVTDMTAMFDDATNFNQDLSDWTFDATPANTAMVVGANNGNFPCSKLPVVLQSGSGCVP
jgi:surface protein